MRTIPCFSARRAAADLPLRAIALFGCTAMRLLPILERNDIPRRLLPAGHNGENEENADAHDSAFSRARDDAWANDALCSRWLCAKSDGRPGSALPNGAAVTSPLRRIPGKREKSVHGELVEA